MDIDTLGRTINNEYAQTRSWRKTGKAFGITSGTARRIANGYEPKDPQLRRLLGLPVLLPAPACAACGQVHTVNGVCLAQARVDIVVTEMSADELAQVENPVTITVRRKPPKRDSRPRATINTASAESAAQTIRRKMSPEMMQALARLLNEDV